jgi:predicted secreted Zn-dependent protease
MSNQASETPLPEQGGETNKLKTFWGVKTAYTLYKVSAETKEEAEELLKRKTPLAATDTQKGVSTIHFRNKLEELKVLEEDTNGTK